MEAAAVQKKADRRKPKAEESKAEETKAKGAKAKGVETETPKTDTPKETDSKAKSLGSGQKKGEKKSPPPRAGDTAGVVATDKEAIMS